MTSKQYKCKAKFWERRDFCRQIGTVASQCSDRFQCRALVHVNRGAHGHAGVCIRSILPLYWTEEGAASDPSTMFIYPPRHDDRILHEVDYNVGYEYTYILTKAKFFTSLRDVLAGIPPTLPLSLVQFGRYRSRPPTKTEGIYLTPLKGTMRHEIIFNVVCQYAYIWAKDKIIALYSRPLSHWCEYSPICLPLLQPGRVLPQSVYTIPMVIGFLNRKVRCESRSFLMWGAHTRSYCSRVKIARDHCPLVSIVTNSLSLV